MQMRQTKTTCSHIGGNEKTGATRAEVFDGAVALDLVLVAVDC